MFKNVGKENISIQNIIPQATGKGKADFCSAIELRYMDRGVWRQAIWESDLTGVDGGEDLPFGWMANGDDDYKVLSKDFGPDEGFLILFNQGWTDAALNIAGEVIPFAETAPTIAVDLNDGFTVASVAIPCEGTYSIQQIKPSATGKEDMDFCSAIELRYMELGVWRQAIWESDLTGVDGGEDLPFGWMANGDDDYKVLKKDFGWNECVLFLFNQGWEDAVVKFPNPCYQDK